MKPIYFTRESCILRHLKIRRIDMKVAVFVLSLLLLTSAVYAAEIDGTWTGEYAGGMGGQPMQMEYTFKADGNKLTGTTIGGPDGEKIPIKDGKIEGNRISFKVDVDFSGMQMSFKYKGELKGDELKLSFEMDMPGGGMGGPGGEAPAQEFTVKKVK